MSSLIKGLIVLFLAGIGACIYSIGTGDLTNRESALLSVLLTFLSILAAWIVSHFYSASQHRKAIDEVKEFHRTNLRTYAIKAAEKVTNLSNQLNRLSVYLQEALEKSDSEHINEELLEKNVRIESAAYLVNTLMSMNDNALSDWDGVIGDLLDQQREEIREREEI